MKTSFFNHPVFSLRRTLLIARRDFVGYVKTWGFWLTSFGPFIGLAFLMMASIVMVKSEPVTYAAIVDETGLHGQAIREYVLEKKTPEVPPGFEQMSAVNGDAYSGMAFTNLELSDHSVDELEDLKSRMAAKKNVEIDGKSVTLAGILHIYPDGDGVDAKYWTTSPQNNLLVNAANTYFANIAKADYMDSGGLSLEDLSAAAKSAVRVAKFDPQKAAESPQDQRVTFEDGLPFFVAAGLALFLWLTIFTGAYMLLVSMVEEKINKVLEMLLATTRFGEIFVGTLVGVAALTFASLAPWIIAGTIGSLAFASIGDVSLISTITGVMDVKMRIFVPVFLVLGYVFYGSMFIALGAIAESMQDASTLMTPMVLLMTICMMVVPIGLNYPDSPIVYFGQWFPFSAPFAAIVRLPSDPSIWETLGSVLSLILSSVFVIWASSQIFQHGVLTGGGVSVVKNWFMHKVLRRTPTN